MEGESFGDLFLFCFFFSCVPGFGFVFCVFSFFVYSLRASDFLEFFAVFLYFVEFFVFPGAIWWLLYGIATIPIVAGKVDMKSSFY